MKLEAGREVDVALAQFVNGVGCELLVREGEAARVTSASLGVRVRKIGRTSGITWVRIHAVSLDNVPVKYGDSVRVFDDQLEIVGDISV